MQKIGVYPYNILYKNVSAQTEWVKFLIIDLKYVFVSHGNSKKI